MQAISQALCKRWNSFLLGGFFLIILGTIALSSAFYTTMATTLVFGMLLLAAGLTNVLHAFWASQWKGFFVQLIVGIFALIVGWLMMTNPLEGAAALTLLLAVFFTTTGLTKIAGSLLLEIEQWGWLLASGLVSLALGLIILASWPQSSIWMLGLFISIDLIVSGWTSVMYALGVRKVCTTKQVA